MNQPKHILLLSQYFPPESNAASIRINSFAKYWQNEDVKVTVLTSHPNFPEGRLHDGYEMSWINNDRKYSTQKLTVKRSWVFLAENKGIVKRSISYLSTFVSFLANGLRIKADVIVASSPPLTVAFCGFILSRLKRIPFIFDVRDLWPEAISYTDTRFPKLALRVLMKFTQYIYKNSDAIVVTSAHQKKSIEDYGIESSRVHLFSNGFEADKMKKLPTDDPEVTQLRQKLNPQSKFLIGYIGNLGRLYDFDFLLDLIKKTSSLNIHYIIGGAGVMREHILNRINSENIENVTFVGKVDHNLINFYINAIDLSIIPMKNIPINAEIRTAKIFEILACEKPVLFIGPPNSESGEIALNSNLGHMCDTNLENCFKLIGEIISTPSNKKINAKYLNQFEHQSIAKNYFHIVNSTMTSNKVK